MTTTYLVNCQHAGSNTIPNCHFVSTSLDQAKSQFITCINNCLNEAQSANPDSTITSKVSSDGMRGIIIIQNNMTRIVDVNGIKDENLSISNQFQNVYCKHVITNVV